MRRKDFLKKMIVAFCAGVLISMPVTANAAEKEDVVGDWTRDGQFSVTFYEDETLKDWHGDTRPYKIVSGSLTVTYDNTGATETVDYDVWSVISGEDGPFGMIYKIIEPGKMKAWNVWKENESKWGANEPSIINKKADTGSGTDSGTDSTGSDYKCEHHYEWTVTTEPTETADGESCYVCTFCGDIKARQKVSADIVICEQLLASIKNAEAGTTVTFDSKSWLCYPQYVLDALKEKGDISLKTDFTYEGINYSFTIPAGSDYTNLEQADFYGFMYLFGAFGGNVSMEAGM